MRAMFFIAALLAFSGTALAHGASARLPIKVRIISYQDTKRACEDNDPDSIGWENLGSFYQACQRMRNDGEIDSPAPDNQQQPQLIEVTGNAVQE